MEVISHSPFLIVETCESEVEGASCIPTNTGVDIYYDGNDTSDFKQRIIDAINEAQLEGMFAGVNGLEGVRNIIVTDDDSDREFAGAIVQEDEDDDDGLAAGAIIGIAIAAVAMCVLLMLFFVGRVRRKESSQKHMMMINDDESSLLDEGEVKKVHVVGEDGDSHTSSSVYTGYTGYTPTEGGSIDTGAIMNDLNSFERGMDLGLNDMVATMDVHKCASATCQICHAKRLRPTFIQTGEAPELPPPIPYNARRGYVADDTVQL